MKYDVEKEKRAESGLTKVLQDNKTLVDEQTANNFKTEKQQEVFKQKSKFPKQKIGRAAPPPILNR